MKETYLKPEIGVRKCFLEQPLMVVNASELGITQAKSTDTPVVDTPSLKTDDLTDGGGTAIPHYDAWGDAKKNGIFDWD